MSDFTNGTYPPSSNDELWYYAIERLADAAERIADALEARQDDPDAYEYHETSVHFIDDARRLGFEVYGVFQGWDADMADPVYVLRRPRVYAPPVTGGSAPDESDDVGAWTFATVHPSEVNDYLANGWSKIGAPDDNGYEVMRRPRQQDAPPDGYEYGSGEAPDDYEGPSPDEPNPYEESPF